MRMSRIREMYIHPCHNPFTEKLTDAPKKPAV